MDQVTFDQVRCGVRREVAACLERVRIVGGDEAGCNEWPWQVLADNRDIVWGEYEYSTAGGSLEQGWVGDQLGPILRRSPCQQQAHRHCSPLHTWEDCRPDRCHGDTVIVESVSELFISCSDRGPQHYSNCNGA